MNDLVVYLVFPSDRLAGCEKRLLGVACHLADSYPGVVINILAPSGLFQCLDDSLEFQHVHARHRLIRHIFDGKVASYPDFWWKTFLFFLRQPRDVIVHYPLNYPVFLKYLFNHFTVVSWVANALPSNLYEKGISKLLTFISFLEADVVDVLNPSTFKTLSVLNWLRGKTRLTDGGTHVDQSIYKPTFKDYCVVFLGRLIPEKQGYRYLQSLPGVCSILRAKGVPVPFFYICGWGPEEETMINCLAREEYSNVPVEMLRTENPSELLARSMIFVSLQKSSNYPSKALAEAMMCGAFPVLTCSPDSELMVCKDLPHSMVPVDFSPSDIAFSIEKAWNANNSFGDALYTSISVAASKRFSVDVQSTYFSNVYGDLFRKRELGFFPLTGVSRVVE
jgi:glycosyltransferase involved in cell wall biosynthesis